MKYKYLVLGSGGYKAFTYIGVLKKLNIKPDVIIGCSAGALLGYLLTMTQNIQDVEQEALDPEHLFFSFKDVSFKNLFYKYGFNDGYKIEKLLMELTLKYLNTQRINFDELFEITNIDFHVVTSNLKEKTFQVFNKTETPYMDVITALRMSISIPFYFTPVLYKNIYYIDGGVYMPEPYKILEDLYSDTISKENAIVLTVNHCISNTKINSLSDYIQTIFEVIRCGLQHNNIDENKCTYIQINAKNIPMIKHDYTQNDIMELIEIGYNVKIT